MKTFIHAIWFTTALLALYSIGKAIIVIQAINAYYGG